MLTETTVSKLREMRLSVMANALKDQLMDPQFQNMAFEDRIGLLVDAEWNARIVNCFKYILLQYGDQLIAIFYYQEEFLCQPIRSPAK